MLKNSIKVSQIDFSVGILLRSSLIFLIVAKNLFLGRTQQKELKLTSFFMPLLRYKL